AFDLGVRGWLRLPLASAQACPSCLNVKNQTLYTTGNLTLAGLHADGDRMEAGITGGLSSARLDEVSVNPARLFSLQDAAATAAVGVAAFLLWRAFAFLFTRVAHE